MKKIAITLAFVAAVATASAQYEGPGGGNNTQVVTVKYVLDNASKLDRNDNIVTIKGFIVEKINEDDYWFKDESGKIKVDIDTKKLPQTAFNEKTLILIKGEVDHDLLGGTEIEAERVEIVTQ